MRVSLHGRDNTKPSHSSNTHCFPSLRLLEEAAALALSAGTLQKEVRMCEAEVSGWTGVVRARLLCTHVFLVAEAAGPATPSSASLTMSELLKKRARRRTRR